MIYNDFFFINSDLGWIVGSIGDSIGTVLKTSDGGEFWTSDIIESVDKLSSIHFIDSNTGWAVGSRIISCSRGGCKERGYIIKTEDGGNNWIVQDSTDWIIPNKIFFLDANMGWIGAEGYILKTSDSGKNWEYIETPYFTEILFIDANNVFGVGLYNVYATSDGGLSWNETDKQYSPRSLFFLNDELGYIVGERGRILKTTDGGNWVNIKTPDKMVMPIGFELYQNYPNPFNPSTKITFTLPKAEHVRIEVYNTLGQRVEILLNQQMKAGHHEIEFDAKNLSSGVYFYQIEAGEFQDVKKMVLLR